MTFTNDDLKRLKDEVNRGITFLDRDGEILYEPLNALLSRLEAAERVVEIAAECSECRSLEKDDQSYQDWRKATGE